MYTIVYHSKVVSDDIPKLSSAQRDKIKHTIETRLAIQPNLYGKPLRRSLKGYRKLRVGDWRVVFKIEGQTVKIFIIQHRSVVYKKSSARL